MLVTIISQGSAERGVIRIAGIELSSCTWHYICHSYILNQLIVNFDVPVDDRRFL